MANNANFMMIAPTQPASSPRMTSQSTQPRNTAASRPNRRNFSATLNKVNAKLDEIKQGINNLQDTEQEAAQIDPDAKNFDEPTSAQGTSDTPQDAPQQDETLSAGEQKSPEDKPKDIKPSTVEEDMPADISFAAEKNIKVPVVVDKDTQPVVVDKETQPVVVDRDTQPVVVDRDTQPVVVDKDTQPVVVDRDTQPVVVERDTQ
ncbi:MAG: hypothetical protein IJL14_04795, partial [Selenomonadaceae bacterium]|nr:hypothetical protein [Selenomonadaceae bacterium]